MTELKRLCYELAFNEYFAEWNGDVEDTLNKLNEWQEMYRPQYFLDDSITVWQPFEDYESEDLMEYINNSVEAYKDFATKILKGET